MGGFTIVYGSGYGEWHRYEVRMMCEMQDESGSRSGFASTSEKDERGCSVLRTGECSRVRLFVYVIPEILPAERMVERCVDFASELRVEYAGAEIVRERLMINPWGGTSVEMLFDSDGLLR